MLPVCTERLELSPLSESDIPLFVGYRRHPDVARYQSWSTDFSVADAEALIAGLPRVGLPTAGEWVQLGARALVTGASARLLVGDVAIQRDVEQPHTFELGMTLAREHQRVGYALEALHGVIGWLMRDHDAHRIIMQGDARNTAVLSLMRRVGLRHEGAAVEGDWFKGEWTTLERFALLRREWLISERDSSQH